MFKYFIVNGNLRVVVAIDSDVVAVVADDDGVGVGAGGRGEGGGHEQGEDDELRKEKHIIIPERDAVTVRRKNKTTPKNIQRSV